MKTLSIFILFLTSFFIRALRWLAVVQQKEYRFDRLMLFLKSNEGKRELLRFFPKKKDFSRTGLKRPKITVRILIVATLFTMLFSFLVARLVLLTYGFGTIEFAFYLFFGLIIYLLITPFLVMVSIFPTTAISSTRILIELIRAKAKVKKAKPIIIGITGSYGKTSTKMLLSKVLDKKYSVFKTPKSYNTKFSVARSINKIFKNQEIMIIEYGAYKKGEIRTLASWFQPSLAIITGLTKQHLGLFGNIESIINAKSELVKSLKSGSIVVYNSSDEGTTKICEAGSGPESTSGGNLEIIGSDNEITNSLILKAHLNKAGKLFFVFAGQQISTNFMGMHYLETIKMVVLVAKKLGVSDKDLVEAISSFVPDDKFIFSYELKSGSLLIDDGGTSNLKGFEAAIKLASAIDSSKKILITSGIVDLGSESEVIHRELAEKASKVFHTVLYVGESGKQQFSNVFKEKFIGGETGVEQTKILSFLSNLDNHEMILVEGRMPGWVRKYLK